MATHEQAIEAAERLAALRERLALGIQPLLFNRLDDWPHDLCDLSWELADEVRAILEERDE